MWSTEKKEGKVKGKGRRRHRGERGKEKREIEKKGKEREEKGRKGGERKEEEKGQ